GSVNPNGQSTSYYFDFGTTTSYGTKTTTKNAGSGTKSNSVSDNVSGLAAGTTYHFRLVASNASGTTFGSDQSFTTSGPPAVETGAAQSIATTTATLTGSVDPRGHSTSWFFEFGTSTSYGTKTASQNVGSSPGSHPVTVAVSNLTAATTYHYRVVASSSGGTSRGSDMTFMTLPTVTITQSDLKTVAGHLARITGTVTGAGAGM